LKELRDYTTVDTLRDTLKTFVRQFNFENKTLAAHKNSFNALLERVFPGVDGLFTSPSKSNGHFKLADFIALFWHNDCIALLSETKFAEKYKKFCKAKRCIFDEKIAKSIYAMTRDNLTTMPKNDVTKLLVQGAAKRVLQISQSVEELRSDMTKLAKQLPEFKTVTSIYGVVETYAAKLIGEIGDVRRFTSKRALVAFAGVDPDKDDSGKKVSISGKISRSGNALLRKVAYQAVECYLLHSPVDDPIYQFLDKKRSEGKNYYVYMTATCNKFSRIYYARVKEFMDSLENETIANETVTPIATTSIISTLSVKNNIAFTCEQDRATVKIDPMSSV
jgi:hypothetical protein